MGGGVLAESEISSMRKFVTLEKSMTALNTRRTVCPRNAERSYVGLCTQPLVWLRFENEARVARLAPVRGSATETVRVS